MKEEGTYNRTPSMAIKPQSSRAIRQLISLGLIPSECTHFELVLDAQEAIRATCTFHVTEEQMQMIADAYAANPEEVVQMIRTASIKTAGYRVGHLEMERIPDLEF